MKLGKGSFIGLQVKIEIREYRIQDGHSSGDSRKRKIHWNRSAEKMKWKVEVVDIFSKNVKRKQYDSSL